MERATRVAVSGRRERRRASRELAADVVGALHVLVRNAGVSEVRALARDVGPAEPIVVASPQAPVLEVRFVNALPASKLRVLDGGPIGFTEDGVYALARRGGAPIAHVTQEARWGQGTILCRRGVRRVPFLSAAVDLAAIAAGWAPLHASAWTTADGVGVLASGFAHSGKTGALLAACEGHARPIGDDRILLAGDGRVMVGLGRPLQAKDWHIAQLRLSSVPVGGARRALARATHSTLAHRATKTASRWGRLLEGALAKGRSLSSAELDLRQLVDDAEPRPRARLDLLLLMETHESDRIVAEPADPATVPTRLAAHIGSELVPVLRNQLMYGYVHPGEGWGEVERAPALVLRILEEAVRGVPAWIIRHPYPCSLARLNEVTSELTASVTGSLGTP